MEKKLILSILLVLTTLSLSSQLPARPQKLKRSDCFFGVHFDLHANESITDAGKSLTYAMVDTFLLKVKPDFIQIDCKGHPGISSYPTKVGYHLKGFEKDPLKLFREVTQKNNVGLYMHFSGVWDGKVVQQHPEWAVVKANGEKSTQKVSFFSPYSERYLIPQLKELAGEYKVDGAWIDGECWAVEPDYGEASVEKFRKTTGIKEIPKKPADKEWPEWMEYTRSLFREHLNKYVEAIHLSNPEFQITSNWAYSSMMPEKVTINVDYISGDVTPQNGVYRSAFESRCIAPQGKPWDLMAWGFSWNGSNMPMSIKSAIQLKQEAAEIIAMGGGVQFYFQQNRDLSIKPWIAGMLSDIGQFCRERQKYVHKSIPVPQIALLYPAEAYQRSSNVPYSRSLDMLQGTLYALLDGQQAVEIRAEHNLTGQMQKYPVIIVPECDYLAPGFLGELREYVKNGGNLVVIGPDASLMFSEELGLISPVKGGAGRAFIEAENRIGSVESDVLEVKLQQDCKPLSYFYSGSDFRNRKEIPSASVRKLGKGNIAGIYFNAGSSYSEYKTFVIRDFVNMVVDNLFRDKVVVAEGSHLAHIAVNKLNERLYINVINVAGDHNGQNSIGYDEIPPLKSLHLTISYPEKPEAVLLQPEGKKLKAEYSGGKISVIIPPTEVHSIIEIL